MPPPPPGLLDRLKSASVAEADRARFDELYRPFLVEWLGRVPGLSDRAEGLAAEIVAAVVGELAGFDVDRDGPFRDRLRRALVEWARGGSLSASTGNAEDFLRRLADPSSVLASEWDAEHDRHVTRRMLEVIRGEFSPATWEGFRQFAIEGQPAAIVALRLGMTEVVVFRAKARILRRLREEAGNLLG